MCLEDHARPALAENQLRLEVGPAGELTSPGAEHSGALVDIGRAIEALDPRAQVAQHGLQNRLAIRLVPPGGVARVGIHRVGAHECLSERDRLIGQRLRAASNRK